MQSSAIELKEKHQSTNYSSKWNRMFALLLDYKKDHGNCLVPNRYKDLPELGRWVSTQRRHYKAFEVGHDSPLTQEHIRSLESIGFTWVTRDPRHVSLK